MSKTILITGASTGIGRALAFAFARRGYRLALTARRLELLEAVKNEISTSHPGLAVEIAALDVAQIGSVASALERFAQRFGRLDIVVANAGTGEGGGLIGTGGFAKDAALMQTNVLGAMATLDAAIAIFRRQRHGQAVAIASVAAARGVPGAASYCASKAALAVYADAARAELHGTDIRVTTLYPGYIDTAINNKMKRRPFLVTVEDGGERIAKLIERRVQQAAVPGWPWGFVMWLLRRLPISLVAKQAPFAD